MIPLEQALRERCIADTKLTQLVGSRVGGPDLPLLAAFPYVLMQQVASRPYTSHQGDSGCEQTTMQISVIGSCYLDVLKVVACLKRLFSGFRGKLGTTGAGINAAVQLSGEVVLPRESGQNVWGKALDLEITWVRDIDDDTI